MDKKDTENLEGANQEFEVTKKIAIPQDDEKDATSLDAQLPEVDSQDEAPFADDIQETRVAPRFAVEGDEADEAEQKTVVNPAIEEEAAPASSEADQASLDQESLPDNNKRLIVAIVVAVLLVFAAILCASTLGNKAKPDTSASQAKVAAKKEEAKDQKQQDEKKDENAEAAKQEGQETEAAKTEDSNKATSDNKGQSDASGSTSNGSSATDNSNNGGGSSNGESSNGGSNGGSSDNVPSPVNPDTTTEEIEIPDGGIPAEGGDNSSDKQGGDTPSQDDSSQGGESSEQRDGNEAYINENGDIVLPEIDISNR